MEKSFRTWQGFICGEGTIDKHRSFARRFVTASNIHIIPHCGCLLFVTPDRIVIRTTTCICCPTTCCGSRASTSEQCHASPGLFPAIKTEVVTLRLKQSWARWESDLCNTERRRIIVGEIKSGLRSQLKRSSGFLRRYDCATETTPRQAVGNAPWPASFSDQIPQDNTMNTDEVGYFWPSLDLIHLGLDLIQR